ncbi:factor in the germline alpha-like [Stylophora pistillata]|uniref:factor in the germline alpha-like n=1 Tax=Stylophora pistillata TaxID=50429 RepID=UPI000C03B275|nr:factor in the germline alpha-like [Stylophora pistillata]
MADEFEATVFIEEKKKRKRRGPRLTGISKQRRMANARERKRVQNLNEEIEVLKSLLPLSPQNKKPTKTEVIWLAAEYIDALTQMLKDAKSMDDFNEHSFLDFDTLLGMDIENLFELDDFDPLVF